MAREFYVNVDMNNNDLQNVDSIAFNTSSTHAMAAGVLRWESSDGTLTLGVNADIDLQLGQEMVVRCYNGTGTTISKGSVVYIAGAQGARPSVALADADVEATSSKTLGITSEAIANGAEGFVHTFGILRNVNTSAFTAGQALWLSSTAGGITNTPPAAPANSVFLGYCVKVNASSGEIFVNVQNGYEIGELHDVSISSAANEQSLVYESSSGLWKNKFVEQSMTIAISDEATALTTGTAEITFRAPFAMTLTQIPRASLSTASSSGLVTVDINESGTSILGANKLSIDANERTSVTAATATTLADTAIADDAEITIDIDAAGTGAKGLKVTLYYRRA